MESRVPPAEWELRILSGLHTGARELLTGSAYVIGSGYDCDLVLQDVGILQRHARLALLEGYWNIEMDGDFPGVPGYRADVSAGIFQLTDTVLICVVDAASAWPSAAQIREWMDANGAADFSGLGAEVPVQEVKERRDGDTDDKSLENSPLMPGVLPLKLRLQRHLMRGGAACLLLLVPMGMGWIFFHGSYPGRLPVVNTAAEASGAAGFDEGAAIVSAIAVAVRPLGLEGIKVAIDGAGRPAVSAGLISASDHERLAMVLSGFNPRPALSVVLEQDMVAQVAETLASVAGPLRGALKSVNLGGGVFRIEGRLKSEQARVDLLVRLKQLLPSVVRLESAILTQEGLAQQMLADLRGAAIAAVEGQWAEDKLRITLQVAKRDMPQLEQLVARVGRRYDIPFEARVKTTQSIAGLVERVPVLPFRMKTVVGGETPYVVTDDGVMLLVDGRWGEWRLAAIDSHAVVFEASASRRVVVQR